ncbi:MAG TPA: AI-2E family transporter [Steroidobacteraceae bacterium]
MEDLVSAPWLRRLITVVLLAVLVILGFQVLDPFIVPIVWAAILGYVSWPAYRRLLRLLGGRTIIASLIMTLIITAAVIAPLAWLIVITRVEVVRAYAALQALLLSGPQMPPALLKLPWIGDQLTELSARMAQDPRTLSLELREWADHSFVAIAHVLGGVTRNAVKLFFAVLSLFFVYRDGEKFASQFARVLEQVLGPRVHNYIEAIGPTVKAVVYGLVLAAVAQGTLAGLGYWAAGVAAPVFLAVLTTVCGLLPFVGPLLWGSIGVWLVATGHTAAGIGLLIWGTIVVSWIDNIVRPFVISRETRIPFLLVMFGVIGGVAAFGLVGLFIGPVILAMLVAIWREYLLESGQPVE